MNTPRPVASAFEEGARPRKRSEHCPWCAAEPGAGCVSLMGRKLRHFRHYVTDQPQPPAAEDKAGG